MVYSLSFSSYLIVVPVCLFKYHIIMQCYKSFKNEYTKQEVQLRDSTLSIQVSISFLGILIFHIVWFLLIPSSSGILYRRGAGLSSYCEDAPSYLGRLNQSQF